MPYKPIRQLAAEQARGNKPANPSQLGDPTDLKAETDDGPDPVESPFTGGDTSKRGQQEKGPAVGGLGGMGRGVGGGPPRVFRKGMKGAKL